MYLSLFPLLKYYILHRIDIINHLVYEGLFPLPVQTSKALTSTLCIVHLNQTYSHDFQIFSIFQNKAIHFCYNSIDVNFVGQLINDNKHIL
jgi:hypothetical protein